MSLAFLLPLPGTDTGTMQGVVQVQRQCQPGTVTKLWLCILFHIMCDCGGGGVSALVNLWVICR